MSKVYQGDCREELKKIPDQTVDCCITSPPYYGLRDYGTGKWVGGDPNCPHRRMSKRSDKTITGHKQDELAGNVGDAIYKTVCPLCGAVREDNQIGLEETPEEYINNLVAVFREVKRVLKNDGTLWVNIGDSYSGSGKGPAGNLSKDYQNMSKIGRGGNVPTGMKAKDLIGIPWMLAFALRADGWYLRQDIIWSKPNPMPESVKDRCTKSHEYIFLLSKKPHYYFDSESIQEDAVSKDIGENIKFGGNKYGNNNDVHYAIYSGNEYIPTGKRNKRDVWSITLKPIKDAHFATFPEELVRPCILAGSRPKGIVLDPFFGSGTTGRVATELNREYIGVELNPDYIEISKKRTNNVQLSMLGLM